MGIGPRKETGTNKEINYFAESVGCVGSRLEGLSGDWAESVGYIRATGGHSGYWAESVGYAGATGGALGRLVLNLSGI